MIFIKYQPSNGTCQNLNPIGFATLDGASLKLVDKFTYLGSSVSSTEKDIDTRLTKAWTAITNKKKIHMIFIKYQPSNGTCQNLNPIGLLV